MDLVDEGRVVGWVRDPSTPQRRLVVELRAGDRVEVALAERERPDLRAAGKGDGRYGFVVRVDLDGLEGRTLHVREAASGWELGGSPVQLDLPALVLAGAIDRGGLALLREEAQRALIRLDGGRP